MAWSLWLVPPIITSIFFVLGVITLYWAIFSWITAHVKASNRPIDVKKVQIAVGTLCAVGSVFALQLLVRDSHLSWTFTTFQLLLLIFVAYFLQLRIPYWVIFIASVGFMFLNGNVNQPLSWAYTVLFVLFYVVSYQQSVHLWRRPFLRYLSIAVIFAAVLWGIVCLRFHLDWRTYAEELRNYTILVVLMYGYFQIQDRDRRIKERLFQSANWDALTHVQNFAAYDRAVGHYFRHSANHQTRLAMIMFDIDHFKQVNDTYGHLAGDEVLKQVAAQVTAVLKKSDPKAVLYRTGGEEFNILLPDYDLTMSTAVAQRVFEGVRDLRITYNDVTIRVTISVGVSELREMDSNPLDFYKRVDANLYRSKKNGRKQITVE